ncbi:MAG TPA: hypothetical protein VNN17_05360 [Terriglobia bacterium]|nr:hypothetical protein [Terriglobia bacterium]
MNIYSNTNPGARLRAGLVGYTGYSGAELANLLERHPAVELVLLDHRKADEGAGDSRPTAITPNGTKAAPRVLWEPGAVRANNLDVVFTATPPEVSQELVPEILSQGARAIDLSGAFRLPTAEQYQRWYGEPHARPELLKEAVYGLPELYREKIRAACLVANPGCYPTAAVWWWSPALTTWSKARRDKRCRT